jgi:lipopolysaccharide export system permease protein
MQSIDRYIFRTTFGGFALVLVSLTAFIWVTQALREIDLMTNQGQAVLVFISMTGLLIPALILIIAPIALVVAVTYTLYKLNADSEITVVSAAGVSPPRLFVPFLSVALVVSLLVAMTSAYISPLALRELRSWAAKVRADLVTTIIQPGRFTTIERGLTFHIRERRLNGELMGIFIADRRDPKEHVTFLAERGRILENEGGTFLILDKGSLQRMEAGQRDPSIVVFERYAFDLSRYATGGEGRSVTARERYLWHLVEPDPNDPLVKSRPGMFRAEFHDRLAAPLYPLAFAVIAFAFLGMPSTTRQSRGMSLALAIGAVALLRLIGFGSAILVAQTSAALIILYGVIGASLAFGLAAISRGMPIEPPAALVALFAALSARLARRPAPA